MKIKINWRVRREILDLNEKLILENQQLSLRYQTRIKRLNYEIFELIRDKQNTAIEYTKRISTDIFKFFETKLTFEEFNFEINESESERVRNLFDTYGSDKSTRHGYEHFYAFLMKELNNTGVLLEIGVGTQNSQIESHMPKSHSPAASLEVWSQLLQGWKIFGLDIDPECKKYENARFTILTEDQTNREGLLRVIGKAGIKEIDLVIDDGLHTPYAGISTLISIWPLLKQGSFYVVEDLTEEHLIVWQVILAQIGFECKPRIVLPKNSSNASFDSIQLFFQKASEDNRG